MGLDRIRFIESCFAAILGDVIVEGLPIGSPRTQDAEIAVAEFKRALIVASNLNELSREVIMQYLHRISELPPHQRIRYFKFVRKSPIGQFYKRKITVVIFDHTLLSDDEWDAIVALHEFREPSRLDAISETAASFGPGTLSTTEAMIENYAEWIEEKKRNDRWLMRMMRWFVK